tara:strand:- start:166 stop:366 length:201 start_codon:yes stop_codon:yes gene_type:complete
MNRVDKGVGTGVSWTTVLVMIFIVLKVMGLTSMNWFWVFSPWWLGIVVVTVAIIVIGILAFLLSDK